ncbi:cytosolic iron-sulfur protein assembly protein [Cladorrhinum sp. PSN259]|nr:cytosolic iron-sulfur protein assembly protein [Cladorrhinum sp. PSN259]
MAPSSATLSPLPPFQPDLYTRAWSSIPHPTRPLLATTHDKSVTIFSLSTLTKHSSLSGGHSRSIRSVAWQPTPNQPHKLRLVTGSFDATAGLWSYDGDESSSSSAPREIDVSASAFASPSKNNAEQDEWEFNLVLEGHENEIKSVSFSPTGQFLATCSRDKTVWIWEEVEEDEWETVAVLSEHEGDVKMVAWMPEYVSSGRKNKPPRGSYGTDCLASASYDDTVRIWREDGDGEWVCVCVLSEFKGTVWGLEWEKDRSGGRGRLVTTCQDGSVKIWERREEEEEEDEDGPKEGNNDWSVPNRMRRELREEWVCVSELPRSHTREVYSASWSKDSGVIATTGGDGRVVLYQEEDKEEEGGGGGGGGGRWKVIGSVSGAHGAYEVNHVVWCKRWDNGTERKGEEEMLVTTGDDGVVRGWEVKFE